MSLIDKDKTLDAISMYLFVNDAIRNDVKVGDYRVFAKSMICDVPEVDIVRCKECKHRYVSGHTTQYYVCDFLDAQNKDDGFCSYGEVRDE